MCSSLILLDNATMLFGSENLEAAEKKNLTNAYTLRKIFSWMVLKKRLYPIHQQQF
jgi:hypothetical protein